MVEEASGPIKRGPAAAAHPHGSLDHRTTLFGLYRAFTFGATALTGAVLRLSIYDQGRAFAFLAPVVFALATLVVLGTAAGTIRLLLLGKSFPLPLAPAASTAPSI